jgi:hypothetical protein
VFHGNEGIDTIFLDVTAEMTKSINFGGQAATGAVKKHGGLKQHKITGLGGSGVALGVMDGFRFADGLRAAGDLVESLVAIGGRRWSLGIAVDLGGSQVTIVTGKIFKVPQTLG